MADDKSERERIREEKLRELQEQAEKQQNDKAESQREAAKQQQEALLKKYTTSEARRRLNTVEMTKPQLAQQVRQQILALIKGGRIQQVDGGKIDGDQMKRILKEMQEDDDGFDIRRR